MLNDQGRINPITTFTIILQTYTSLNSNTILHILSCSKNGASETSSIQRAVWTENKPLNGNHIACGQGDKTSTSLLYVRWQLSSLIWINFFVYFQLHSPPSVNGNSLLSGEHTRRETAIAPGRARNTSTTLGTQRISENAKSEGFEVASTISGTRVDPLSTDACFTKWSIASNCFWSMSIPPIPIQVTVLFR